MSSSIISYNDAMRIVHNGKYYNHVTNNIGRPSTNIVCDYCSASNLVGSWRLEELVNIDLCMDCFTKLRQNSPKGLQSLPMDMKSLQISQPSDDSLFVHTFMMQDSVRPRPQTKMMQDSVRRNPQLKVHTYMIQDSVRPQIQTNMMQDSVRRNPKLEVHTYMMQDSVRPIQKKQNDIQGYNGHIRK